MARRNTNQCSPCCSDIFNYFLRLRLDQVEIEQRYKSREIDKFLEKDKYILKKQVIVIYILHWALGIGKWDLGTVGS
jgi:hypothetical protein